MRRKAEFLRIRRMGRSCSGKYIVFAILRDDGVPDFRFGFVTSKRVGGAVARNRVRRRLRAIVQREGDALLRGHYVVMIAKRGAAEASFSNLLDEWRALAQRSGILRPGTAQL